MDLDLSFSSILNPEKFWTLPIVVEIPSCRELGLFVIDTRFTLVYFGILHLGNFIVTEM